MFIIIYTNPYEPVASKFLQNIRSKSIFYTDEDIVGKLGTVRERYVGEGDVRDSNGHLINLNELTPQNFLSHLKSNAAYRYTIMNKYFIINLNFKDVQIYIQTLENFAEMIMEARYRLREININKILNE